MEGVDNNPVSIGSGCGILRIRWVTWWPVPYWNDRFEALASKPEVDFEAIFMARGSKVLPIEVGEMRWNFRHSILRENFDDTGYAKARLRFPKPQLLARGDFDALVMTYAEITCILAALLCKILGKPFYLFVPNTVHDVRPAASLREFVKTLLLNWATGIFATGPAQRDYALKYLTDSKNIFLIGNPSQSRVDLKIRALSQRDKLREKFGWTDQVVLLYVGRLSEEKDLATLLSALAIAKADGIVEPTLVLAGSGPIETELRAEAERTGIKVRFAGFVQPYFLPDYYAAADVFVLPSRSEPWGLVVNEAMEYGLPSILSDRVGSCPVLLREGETGFSFPSGNADVLAKRIGLLCGDMSMRQRMGAAALKLIEEHSIEHWVRNVIAAIQSRKFSLSCQSE